MGLLRWILSSISFIALGWLIKTLLENIKAKIIKKIKFAYFISKKYLAKNFSIRLLGLIYFIMGFVFVMASYRFGHLVNTYTPFDTEILGTDKVCTFDDCNWQLRTNSVAYIPVVFYDGYLMNIDLTYIANVQSKIKFKINNYDYESKIENTTIPTRVNIIRNFPTVNLLLNSTRSRISRIRLYSIFFKIAGDSPIGLQKITVEQFSADQKLPYILLSFGALFIVLGTIIFFFGGLLKGKFNKSKSSLESKREVK